MATTYSLNVKEVRKETADTVSIAFDIPENIKEAFSYHAGQYITLLLTINGENLRRPYSFSSAPHENDYRIAVKRVEGGRASTYLTQDLTAGTAMEVLAPAGKFLLTPNSANKKNYVGFAAGSGITPLISMLKTVLHSEPESVFYLFYCNQQAESVIFKNELDAFALAYPERCKVIYIYTRQDSGNDLYRGRIDGPKALQLLHAHSIQLRAAHYFICGPASMIKGINESLLHENVPAEQIHYEYFSAFQQEEKKTTEALSGTAMVTVVMDGIETHFEMPRSGGNILDYATEHGVDAPFSCKGAVCCTCKAKVMEGKAGMEMNYALSDAEVEQGFVLTCQAFPISDTLRVDYDEIF